MALFVLKDGFQIESTPTGGRVVHVRTGDALELSAPEVALLARATAGGVDSQDAELRPLLKKLARMGLLVPAAGKVSELEASLQVPPASAPQAPPLAPDAIVPFFRRDLQLTRVPDSSTYQVSDAAANRTFTLYDFELSLARMLDGKRQASEVLEAGERLGIPVNLDSLGKFIRQLELYGFLAAPDAAQLNRQQPREKWDDNLRQLFQSGLKLSRQGRYIEAAQYFEAMLAQDPQNPEALERLAQVRQRLGLPAPAEADSFLAPPAEGGEMDWGAGLPTELDAEIPSLLFSAHESEPQVAEAGPSALAALEAAAATEAAELAKAATPSPLEAGVMAAVDEAPPWSDDSPAPAAQQEIAIEVGAEDAGEVEIAVEASESAAPLDWSDLNVSEEAAPAALAVAAPVPAPVPEPEPEPEPVPASSGIGAALFDVEPVPAPPAASEPAPKPAVSGLEAAFFDSEPPAESQPSVEEKPVVEPAPVIRPLAVAEKVREQGALPMAMPERMHVGQTGPSKLSMLLAGVAVAAVAFAGGWFVGFRSGEKSALLAVAAKPVVAAAPAKAEDPKPADSKPAEPKPEPAKQAEPAVASPVDQAQVAVVPAKFEGKIPPADPVDSKIPEDEGEGGDPAALALAAKPAEPVAQQPAAQPAAAGGDAISAEISKRGRVTMCTLAAPAEGQVAWTAKEQQRIKKGQPLGNLGAAPLSAPCAGLLIPLVAEKGAAAAGETLADVVYHQGYLKTLVPGDKKPEASWGCEVVDEASGQKTGCTINQASPKAGGFFITAIYEPMWVDTAEQPKLLVTPK